MDAGEIPFPLEIVIEGTPRSHQGNPAEWKARVLAEAQVRVREVEDFGFLDNRPIAVTIFYFPVAAMQGDVLHRYKTGFVGPGFINMGAPQHHVQPLHRVVTDA